MFAHITCIYEKFSVCKYGDSCKYQHPTLVCDDQMNCDIINCHKRHPQVCLHDTAFKNCMNDGICRYYHKKNDALNDVDEEQYRDLEEKYEALLEKCQRMEKRIEELENSKNNSLLIKRIETLENDNNQEQSSRSRIIQDNKIICTRSKSQGDMKRKLSSDEPETILNDKKNKIDKVTIVSDDKNTVSQTEKDSNMEVEIVEKIIEASNKCDEVSYGVYYRNFEKELQSIKKIVDEKKKMTAIRSIHIKDRIRSIENDDKLEKKTENMINRSKVFRKNFENMCEKIDKIELSKFKKVTSDEIQKLINACKNEQKITK